VQINSRNRNCSSFNSCNMSRLSLLFAFKSLYFYFERFLSTISCIIPNDIQRVALGFSSLNIHAELNWELQVTALNSIHTEFNLRRNSGKIFHTLFSHSSSFFFPLISLVTTRPQHFCQTSTFDEPSI
jgi:hypothetical protein